MIIPTPSGGHEREYDVALSFAGEQRPYVRRVASALRNLGVRVFYDDYEQATLWGKDLYEHLDFIYGRAATYCVLFVSRDYASKVWTNHERKSAQARALEEHVEYILPVRFDTTMIPGLRNTIGYVDASLEPEELAGLVVAKLGPRPRRLFLPPVPDRLFAELGVSESEEERAAVHAHARKLLESLSRMSPDERRVLLAVFLRGCPAELPDNVHISVDLLRRVVGRPASEVLEILGGLRSLGVSARVREEEHDGDLGLNEVVVVEWWDYSVNSEDDNRLTTGIADAMIGLVGEGLCTDHAAVALEFLDFRQLASATAEADVHRSEAEGRHDGG